MAITLDGRLDFSALDGLVAAYQVGPQTVAVETRTHARSGSPRRISAPASSSRSTNGGAP